MIVDSATRHFTAAAIRAALPYPALLDRVGMVVRNDVVAPQRLRANGETGVELLAMPAVGQCYAGLKLLTVVQANAAKGLPVIGGSYILFSTEDGRALATMDVGELTGRRTAAVSAFASRQLSRRESSSLLLCGSGHMIPYLAEAHAAVRPIKRISVWARDLAKGKDAAQRVKLCVPDIDVDVVSDLDEAVGCNDIISAATSATEPIIRGACLRPGTHIDLIGSYRPDMRELDDAGVQAARIFVDNVDTALCEAGDLIMPINKGVIGPEAIKGDMKALASGVARCTPEEITLFKAVGSAVADLAAASLVWESLDDQRGADRHNGPSDPETRHLSLGGRQAAI